MSDGKFTAHPNPALMGTDTRTLRFKDDLHSDKATTQLQARPKEALPRWRTTSQRSERVRPFQSNPLVRASVTKVVALAITNGRPGRAIGSPSSCANALSNLAAGVVVSLGRDCRRSRKLSHPDCEVCDASWHCVSFDDRSSSPRLECERIFAGAAPDFLPLSRHFTSWPWR
jgi:hypothetical protein